jgi:hypothetical protein
METARLPESTWRILAGFLVAPLVGAAAMACVQPFHAGLQSIAEQIYRTTIALCLFGAYPATIIFGLPTFLLLRRKVAASPLNCALAGACVAAAPWLALALFSLLYVFGGGYGPIANGRDIVRGWIEFSKMILEVAAFGALGGLVFWLIATAGARRRTGVSA